MSINEPSELEINITTVHSEKYPDLNFNPVVLGRLPLTNEHVGQAMANIRLKMTDFLKQREKPTTFDFTTKENWNKEIPLNDLEFLADELHLPIVFMTTADHSKSGNWEGGHATLALENPRHQSDFITVYDPASPNGIEYLEVAKVNIDTQAHFTTYAINTEKEYSLKLEESDFMANDLNKRMQTDGYNCGLLSLLNGMLRANSLGLIGQNERDLIQNEFGINVAPPVKFV